MRRFRSLESGCPLRGRTSRFGRLTTVKADVDGDTNFDQQINYEYDPVTGQKERTYTGDADPTHSSILSDDKAVTDTVYRYDTLGRLDSVTINERFDTPLATPEVTDYVYDLVGNLAQTRSPNGVITDYDYDALNRLDLLRNFNDDGDHIYETDQGATDVLLSEFNYDVRADGKRTGVTEKVNNGTSTKETRVDWLYDNIGRLTAEAYDADVSVDEEDALAFIARYKFDLVGNRLDKDTDRAATNAAISAFLSTGALTADLEIDYAYDANDRLLTETKNDLTAANEDRHTVYGYDVTQQISKDVYTDDTLTTPIEQTDYEFNLQGRMDSADVDLDADGTVDRREEYEYDDSGIRVAKTEKIDSDDDGTVDTTTRTDYHVDKNNPTGYAQVLEEMLNGTLSKTYTIGHDVFAEAIAANQVRHLLKDGHGSTRQLVDALGNVIDSSGTAQIFAYDAYGISIGFSLAAALTTLLYNSEQLDKLTGLQYLRARYYNPATGTFTRLDPFAGKSSDPQSLHKYLYVHGDPIQGIDPTGRFGLALALGLVSLLAGSYLAFRVRSAYDSNVVSTGIAVGTGILLYLGAFWLSNIVRYTLQGDTHTVNIYVPPLGEFAGDTVFTNYRSNVLAARLEVETRLNRVSSRTTFTIIDGAMPEGIRRGYDWGTTTLRTRPETTSRHLFLV